MIQFRPLSLKDRPLFREKLRESPSRQLVDCFPAFYLWREVLHVRFATIGHAMVCSIGQGSETRFFHPFGREDFSSVHPELAEHCRQTGIRPVYTKVRREQAEKIGRAFPEARIVPVRDHAEYLYRTDRFRSYSGKKLKAKRNFVNQLKKNTRWQYGPLTGEDTAECLGFVKDFSGDDSFRIDNAALVEALKNWEEIELDGGVLRIDGKVRGLFIASATGDDRTAAGLFLRADHSVKGIAPVLYQEFFRAHPRYEWFNLGEDLGMEGLRKNKLSFVPDELLELNEICF